MEEPTFDIFSGIPNERPVWLEVVRGLSPAQKRIEQIAASEPGAYFLFSVQAHRVLSQLDTREPLRLEEAGCHDFLRN